MADIKECVEAQIKEKNQKLAASNKQKAISVVLLGSSDKDNDTFPLLYFPKIIERLQKSNQKMVVLFQNFATKKAVETEISLAKQAAEIVKIIHNCPRVILEKHGVRLDHFWQTIDLLNLQIDASDILINKEALKADLKKDFISFYWTWLEKNKQFNHANKGLILNCHLDVMNRLDAASIKYDALEKYCAEELALLPELIGNGNHTYEFLAGYENSRIDSMKRTVLEHCEALNNSGGIIVLVSFGAQHLQRLAAQLSIQFDSIAYQVEHIPSKVFPIHIQSLQDKQTHEQIIFDLQKFSDITARLNVDSAAVREKLAEVRVKYLSIYQDANFFNFHAKELDEEIDSVVASFKSDIGNRELSASQKKGAEFKKRLRTELYQGNTLSFELNQWGFDYAKQKNYLEKENQLSPLMFFCGSTTKDIHIEALIKKLIAAGEDVNEIDQNRKTAIFYARKHLIISWLAKAGANLDAQDSSGKTRLSYAKDPEMIDILLKLKASVIFEDSVMVSPLMLEIPNFFHEKSNFLRYLRVGTGINPKTLFLLIKHLKSTLNFTLDKVQLIYLNVIVILFKNQNALNILKAYPEVAEEFFNLFLYATEPSSYMTDEYYSTIRVLGSNFFFDFLKEFQASISMRALTRMLNRLTRDDDRKDYNLSFDIEIPRLTRDSTLNIFNNSFYGHEQNRLLLDIVMAAMSKRVHAFMAGLHPESVNSHLMLKSFIYLAWEAYNHLTACHVWGYQSYYSRHKGIIIDCVREPSVEQLQIKRQAISEMPQTRSIMEACALLSLTQFPAEIVQMILSYSVQINHQIFNMEDTAWDRRLMTEYSSSHFLDAIKSRKEAEVKALKEMRNKYETDTAGMASAAGAVSTERNAASAANASVTNTIEITSVEINKEKIDKDNESNLVPKKERLILGRDMLSILRALASPTQKDVRVLDVSRQESRVMLLFQCSQALLNRKNKPVNPIAAVLVKGTSTASAASAAAITPTLTSTSTKTNTKTIPGKAAMGRPLSAHSRLLKPTKSSAALPIAKKPSSATAVSSLTTVTSSGSHRPSSASMTASQSASAKNVKSGNKHHSRK